MLINEIANWDAIVDVDNILDSFDNLSNDAIYTVTGIVYDSTLPGLKNVFYATQGIYDGVYYFEPRLKQPGNFQQNIFANGTTGGASQTGYGEIVLINSDGGLDVFPTYGLDGRPIVLRKIIAGVATILMSCSMEQPIPTWDTVPIRIKDKQQLFNVSIQPTKYGGTNILPGGNDGTDDIKGQPIPLGYGDFHNATPKLVNTSRLIYQGHESALQDIPAVYDKGVSLVRGADYASAADMQATGPAPGTYRAYLAAGMFRLGSSPAGQITFDGIEGATAADRTAAQIAKRIALRVLSSGEIDTVGVTTLDTANSAVVGIYISNETNVAPVLDEVLNSVGAWYGFDSLGILNMGRLEAPTGTPIATLTTAEILEISRQATADEGRGVPPYKVNLGYNKNYTVQTKDNIAGILNTAWGAPATLPGVAGYYCKLLYGNGLFVLLSTGTTTYYTSPDAITWTSRTLPGVLPALPGSQDGLAAIYAGNQFVLMAYNTSVIYTSSDGITWATRAGSSGGPWQSLSYGNGTYVAVRNSGTTSCVQYSYDAIVWFAANMPVAGDWRAVGFGNGMFLATRYGAGINGAATSLDGITWTAQTLGSSHGTMKIIYANGLFVLCGQNNVLFTTPNGVNYDIRNLNASGYATGDYGAGKFCFPISVANLSGPSLLGATLTTDLISFYPNTTATIGSTLSPPNVLICYGDGLFVMINHDTNTSYNYRATAGVDRAQYLLKDYRTVTLADSSVLTKHPTARELNINTLIVNGSDAVTEATRILALRKVDRDYLSVKVHSNVLSSDLLGKVISIQVPRYGYDSGKLFVITGATYDYELGTTTLQVWG